MNVMETHTKGQETECWKCGQKCQNCYGQKDYEKDLEALAGMPGYQEPTTEDVAEAASDTIKYLCPCGLEARVEKLTLMAHREVTELCSECNTVHRLKLYVENEKQVLRHTVVLS